MAKFALVRYGSNGRGPESQPDKTYTYVVNDNVRTKDIIQVISTSHGNSPKKFATTGYVKSAFKENSAKGQEAKIEAQKNTNGADPTQSYSGKELGVKASKIPIGQRQSQYTMETRAGNIAMYMQQHPNAQLTKNAQETFDSYSKQFMPKGEQ